MVYQHYYFLPRPRLLINISIEDQAVVTLSCRQNFYSGLIFRRPRLGVQLKPNASSCSRRSLATWPLK
jgi:hypothetical protein